MNHAGGMTGRWRAEIPSALWAALLALAAVLAVWYGGAWLVAAPIAGFLAAIAAFRPDLGCLFLLGWAACHPHLQFGWKVNALRYGDDLLIAALLAGWLGRHLITGTCYRFREARFLFLPVGSFLGFGALSWLANGSSPGAAAWSTRQALYAAIPFFIIVTERWPETRLRRFFHATVALGILQAVAGLAEYLLDARRPGYWRSAFGLVWSHNYLGWFLNLTLAFALANLLHSSLPHRRFWKGVAGLSVATLPFATSVQSALSFTLVTGYLFLHFRKPRKLMVFGLLGLYAAAFLLSTHLIQDKYRRFSKQFDPTDRGRWYVSRVEWDIFKDHPFLGVGPGTFGTEAALRRPSALLRQYGLEHATSLEGDFGTTLVERGLLGLLAMLGMFAAFWKASLRWERSASESWWQAKAAGFRCLVGLVAFHGLFIPAWYSSITAPFLWILGGILAQKAGTKPQV